MPKLDAVKIDEYTVMETISSLLADPTIRGWYLTFCIVMLVGPMISLSVWYHRNVNQTPGGRDLMKRQKQSRNRGLFLSDGVGMARDIKAGRYGSAVRLMQRRIYWLSGLWIALNVATFGVLIWADEINRLP